MILPDDRIKDIQDTAWRNLPSWVRHLNSIEAMWARMAVDAMCLEIIKEGPSPLGFSR